MNIEQARFNMIEQQIRPWDVLDQSVLSLLSVVKREDFVPPAYRSLASISSRLLESSKCCQARRQQAAISRRIPL